jgi:HAMP domain-containing protein
MIRTYALLDLNGINLLDTKTANVGKSERDQEYFIRPIDNGLNYISNVLFVEDGPSVYFSSPVWDARGKLLGVLRFQYNAQILQDVLMSSANQFTAPELYAVLMDKQYYIRYAHSRDYGAIYRSYLVLDGGLAYQLQSMKRLPAAAIEDLFTNQSDFVEWMNNRKEQPFYSTSAFALGGEPAISTYAELEKAPWVVVTRQSMDVALLPVEQQTEFSVILSLIVAVLMAGVAIGATQIFSAPISHLTSVAEQIAHGDLSARANVETADEVGALAKTFNSMTDELQNTLLDLEKRIKDRTRAIELSADISRRLSIILDPAQLVSEVVDLLQFAFDYYHVQIYLFDDARQNLVMVGGTGEAGKTMIDREQKLAKGQGLVGRASDTGAVVIAADTFKDPQWLPNPLLPETKSEIAVPIILGDLILGALDVQQDTVDGLGHQDADLLSAVANQVAIALRNARQFRRAQLQAERQVRLGAAIEQIQNTQTIENALQVAVRELGRLFDVSHARVRVGMKQDGNGSE